MNGVVIMRSRVLDRVNHNIQAELLSHTGGLVAKFSDPSPDLIEIPVNCISVYFR